MTTRATALVSESEKLRGKMLEAVNGRRLVTLHECLDDPIPATAECVVIALAGLESRLSLEACLRQAVVRRRPVIIVSGAQSEWFRRRLKAYGRLRVEEIKRELLPLIIRAICASERERMRDRVRTSHVPPALGKALVCALRAAETRPHRGTGELASAARSSVTALDDALRVATGGAFTFTEFLSALQLVRALELRSAGKTWTQAAEHLDFTRRSLNRKSRVWPGCTLTELELWDAPALLAQLEHDYLLSILDSA